MQTRKERMEANKFFRAVDHMVYLLEETMSSDPMDDGENEISCRHEWDDGLWLDNDVIKINFWLDGTWQWLASGDAKLSSTQVVMCEALAKLVPKYCSLPQSQR